MILLDTHALWWLLDRPHRFGDESRASLRAGATYASAISLTELTIKAMVGKFTLPTSFADRVTDQGLRWLPYSDRHARLLPQFPELARHDPFDRMLLAQSQAEGMDFLTADRRMLGLRRSWIRDARA